MVGLHAHLRENDNSSFIKENFKDNGPKSYEYAPCNKKKTENTHHVNKMYSYNQLAVNPYQNYTCVAYFPYIITYPTYTVCHTSHIRHMYVQSCHNLYIYVT